LRGTAPNGNPANALNLGYNNNANATNSFDGWFADVRLYNTALTPAQLETIRAPAAPPSGSPFAAPPAQRH
jgi:hypothetical protein